MKKKIILIAILLIAAVLRFYRYAEFPGYETADEFAWTFLGASLIQEGQPTSWSYFEAYYPNYEYAKRGEGTGASFVRPALDHPPFFALIPGAFHSLKYFWQDTPSLKLIRLPMVLIGILNVYLCYLLSTFLFKKPIYRYLATLIYATAPSFVISSRAVLAENFLTTLGLLTIIYLYNFKAKRRYFFLTLFSILAIFSKISGFTLPATIFFYALAIKDKKMLQVSILSGLIGLIGIILYASFYNFPLFLQVNLGQAQREISFYTITNRFLRYPTLLREIFIDGWLYLGLFATVIHFFQNSRKHLAIFIFVILQLLFIALSCGEKTYHGWYAYLLFPIYALNISWLFKQILEKKLYSMFCFTWLIMLALFRTFLTHLLDQIEIYKFIPALITRLIIFVGFIPVILNLIGKKPQLFIKILVILLLSINIMTIFSIKHHIYDDLDQYLYLR